MGNEGKTQHMEHLQEKIIAECSGVLRDKSLVDMFFNTVEFMRRILEHGDCGTAKTAAFIYWNMIKKYEGAACRIVDIFFRDYLRHFDDMGRRAFFKLFKNTHPNYKVVYDNYKKMGKPHRTRYLRLYAMMAAQCKNFTANSEAMYVVSEFSYYVIHSLYNGEKMNELIKDLKFGKRFFIMQTKRKYYKNLRKVIPVAVRVFELSRMEYHAFHQDKDAVYEAYSRACNYLLFSM